MSLIQTTGLGIGMKHKAIKYVSCGYYFLGKWRFAEDIPRRLAGSSCRHWATLWSNFVLLVRQEKPSRSATCF